MSWRHRMRTKFSLGPISLDPPFWKWRLATISFVCARLSMKCAQNSSFVHISESRDKRLSFGWLWKRWPSNYTFSTFFLRKSLVHKYARLKSFSPSAHYSDNLTICTIVQSFLQTAGATCPRPKIIDKEKKTVHKRCINYLLERSWKSVIGG